MYKHKWDLHGQEWRCGWCHTTLPNTPAGRKKALNGEHNCDRRTPEKRKAEAMAAQAAADAVDAEIATYRAAQKLGEPLPELSKDARDELMRLTVYPGQYRAKTALMAAMVMAGLSTPYRR